jgi:hypothetical protein
MKLYRVSKPGTRTKGPIAEISGPCQLYTSRDLCFYFYILGLDCFRLPSARCSFAQYLAWIVRHLEHQLLQKKTSLGSHDHFLRIKWD